MSHPSSSIIRNQLLRAFSHEDLSLIYPHLQPVSLQVRDVLVEPNEPIEHVYFIEQGIGSVVAISSGDERIEVGNVGREGMVGTPVLLGVDRSPHLTFVQVAGSALRMESSALEEAMSASPTLQKVLLQYLHTTTIQTSHTALANGRFSIRQRLARWLLMSHDRVDSDHIPITHVYLSLMLGVRRPGVTEQLHYLEGEHTIKAKRGQVTLLDRLRLEEIAADSYGSPEREYARLIRSQSRSRPEAPMSSGRMGSSPFAEPIGIDSYRVS